MGIRTVRRTSVSRTKTKPDTQANKETSSREAGKPILCGLLCVVRDQRRRQTLLDMSNLQEKPDNQVKGRMRFRRAREPFLCDLLYVDRVQSRRQILLDVFTLLVELQGGSVEMLMRRECQALQNH